MNLTIENVGSYIRELRTKRDMPLRKLASALDIDTSTLAKMEKGQRNFSLNMAPALAKALEIDFKELQVALLASIIVQEHGNEEYAYEALKRALKNIS